MAKMGYKHLNESLDDGNLSLFYTHHPFDIALVFQAHPLEVAKKLRV
jgi:hypothetical protein